MWPLESRYITHFYESVGFKTPAFFSYFSPGLNYFLKSDLTISGTAAPNHAHITDTDGSRLRERGSKCWATNYCEKGNRVRHRPLRTHGDPCRPSIQPKLCASGSAMSFSPAFIHQQFVQYQIVTDYVLLENCVKRFK